MKQSEPKCPYCGTEMILYVDDATPRVPPYHPDYWEPAEDWRFRARYVCEACSRRTGTMILTPQAHGSVRKEVERAAYLEALRRPLQKPLTLEELKALIYPCDEVVTFCESKDSDRTYANIWIGDSVIDFASIEQKINVHFGSYGKTWRAWATRPTDEERAAAPWEE